MAEKDRDLFEVKKKNSELEEYIIQASLFLLAVFFFSTYFSIKNEEVNANRLSLYQKAIQISKVC